MDGREQPQRGCSGAVHQTSRLSRLPAESRQPSPHVATPLLRAQIRLPLLLRRSFVRHGKRYSSSIQLRTAIPSGISLHFHFHFHFARITTCSHLPTNVADIFATQKTFRRTVGRHSLTVGRSLEALQRSATPTHLAHARSACFDWQVAEKIFLPATFIVDNMDGATTPTPAGYPFGGSVADPGFVERGR